MSFISANRRLVVFGVVWGLLIAVLPAVFAFDDPFTVSPFLVSAFVCAAFSGVAGALFAGGWVSGRAGMLAILFAGVLHGLVFAALASVSIWMCLAVNISGFSVAMPGNIFNLAGNPGIFAMSGIAARAIFVYSLIAGMILSPISGGFIRRVVRAGGGSVAGYDMRSEKGSA